MTCEVDVNLNSTGDPNAMFGVFAYTSDPTQGSAQNNLSLKATTNVPGLANLFDLTLGTNTASSGLALSWSSDDPTINANSPLTQSAFTLSGNSYFLTSQSSASFSLFFTVPAGDFGSDAQGPTGLQLDTLQTETAMVTAVPEPSSLALVCLGLGILARRRRAYNR